MRTSRLKICGQAAVYHCICRINAQAMLLDSRAKEVFRRQMWLMSDFCGVQVLTYCLMTNHVHLLVRVPEPSSVSDEELLRRFALLYSKQKGRVFFLQTLLKAGGKTAEEERAKLLARMGDISAFMKELKQRFSIWFNKAHGRIGTLWTERFKSLVVENSRTALMTVAAYIDLNAVRAGLCSDPMDYRFCGYAEALGGDNQARVGITLLTETGQWREAAADYRMMLFGKGAQAKSCEEAILSTERVQEVIRAGGQLPRAMLLRCRVRYFSDGAILGSEAFVRRVFEACGGRRERKGRILSGSDWGGLCVLRDLRKQVFY